MKSEHCFFNFLTSVRLASFNSGNNLRNKFNQIGSECVYNNMVFKTFSIFMQTRTCAGLGKFFEKGAALAS